jgi:transcriptional regulator with XRE-family HTH domain
MNTREVIQKLKKHGLTQSEMSRLSGVPQPTISRAERGRHTSCSEKTLNALLAVLKQKNAA